MSDFRLLRSEVEAFKTLALCVVQDGSLLPTTNLCYVTPQKSEYFYFAYVEEVYITHLSLLYKNLTQATVGKGNEEEDFV